MSQGKPVKISAAKIDAMDIGEEMWDAIVTGLHIRAGARNKSIHFSYRTLNGQRRNPVIGRYGIEIKSIDHARDLAQDWALQVAKGGDPSLDKEVKRSAGPLPTLRDLKKKWDDEVAIAKMRRSKEDALIHSNELDDLQIIKKKRATLADLAKGTISLYESRWRILIDHFGEDCTLASITDEDIEKLHQEQSVRSRDQERGFWRGGPVTANRTLTFITILFNLAKDWKMLDQNRPAPKKVVSPYVERGRERPMTEEELTRFINICTKWLEDKSLTKRRIARLASLCLVCGTRSGEFKTSRLSWVNWSNGTLKVPKAKGDNWKTIPLGNVAMFILKQRHEEWTAAGGMPEHDWIIQGDDPAQYFKGTKKAWILLLKAAGIPYEGKNSKLNLHDLRHTFVTRMVNSGSGSQDQAGKIVGHKNKETTDIYSHLMIGPACTAINKTYQDFELLLKPAQVQITETV